MRNFFVVEEVTVSTVVAFIIIVVALIAIGERIMHVVFVPLIAQRYNKIFNVLLFWLAYIFLFIIVGLAVLGLAVLFGLMPEGLI
jgi:hypothetical protein